MANNKQVDDWQDVPLDDGIDDWQDIEEAPSKSFMQEATESFDDLSRGISEGVPGYGLLQKAGIAAGSALRAPFVDEDFDEIYDAALARDMKKDKDAYERSPVLNTAGNIAGGLATPGIKGSTGVKGIAQRVAGNAALSGVDSATRDDDVWDGERFVDAATLSGGITAGLEALPYVGKATKAVGSFLMPGTNGSWSKSNEFAAGLAGLNPFSKATADEVEDLYTDVAGRRDARTANFHDDTIAVAEKMNHAEGALNDRVSTTYQDLVNEARKSPFLDKDAKGIENFITNLSDKVSDLKSRPEMFSSDAKKVIERVHSTITKGAINESALGGSWAGKAIDEIDGMTSKGQALRYRLLDSRRELDDVMKNKNWDKLNKNDHALITDLRRNVNEQLHKNLSNSSKMKQADELYSKTIKTLDESVGSAKVKGVIDPTRLKNNLNTDLVRGKQFETGVKNLEDFVKQSETVIGEIPEVTEALTALRELQTLAAKRAKLDIAERSAGGPTGQGANNIAQALAAYTSSGWSLLALPITNPSAYTRLIDAAAEMGGSNIAKKMSAAVKATMSKAPQVITRMYTLRDSHD